MATGNMQMLLFYKYRMQRNRHRIMKIVRASQEKREHRFWVHEILRRREEKGAYYNLVRELQLDAEKHHQYFRMSAEKMDHVLSFVGPVIQKKMLVREPLEPKQRLAICLRCVYFH